MATPLSRLPMVPPPALSAMRMPQSPTFRSALTPLPQQDGFQSLLSNVGDWLGDRSYRLRALGGQLMSGNYDPMVMMQAAQMDRSGIQQRKQMNQTRSAFERAGRNDLIEFLDAGGDPMEAYSVFLKDMRADSDRATEMETRKRNSFWIKDEQLKQAYIDGEFELADVLEMERGGGGKAQFGLNPQYGVDAQGNPVLMQLGSDGRAVQTQMPDGVSLSKEPIRLDAGTHFVLLDPITRQTVGTIPKNGDVPPGYLGGGEGGGITPMPGSEQDIERQSNQLKMSQRAQAADQRADIVINAIDKATEQSNWGTTGILGSAGRAIGITPNIDLEGTINTIKANIGFNELQEMREASPTGGALGQVAVQELNMLQSVIASLDPRQGEAQLDENLKTIKQLLERQKLFRQAALEEQLSVAGGGGMPAPVAGGGAPSASDPLGLNF